MRGILRRLRPDRWTAAAAAAGLLWAAAFPPVGVALLGWLAPLLVLAPGLGAGSSRPFRLGYVAGLTHHLATLHWLLFNPFPAGAVAGWIALSAYLSLYPAVWVWICLRLLRRGQQVPSTGGASPIAWHTLLGLSARRRALWALAGAAVWVGLELLRARLFSGFPWNTLGVSQVKNLALIQLAAFTGVGGISFVMVWFSLSLPGAMGGLWREARRPAGRGGPRPEARWPLRFGPALRELLLPGLALTGVLGLGVRELLRPIPDGSLVRVALVQPAIPQKLIFDPDEDQHRFDALMELSAAALRTGPDLLVWPEASLPNIDRDAQERLLALITRHDAWFVLGADDSEASPEVPGRIDSYNAAFLFDPEARHQATYRKQQLVIFGEYVPLERWLPWLARLTPIGGSLREGAGPVPFDLEPPAVRCSVVICFEDTFARVVRRHVAPETDFLLNLTNDAWFGRSAEQWQHLATATFRAVENRVPLVRCANNGISGWVDERGGWHDLDFGPGSTVYDAGFKIVEIPRRRQRTPTLYNRRGDWFGGICGLTGGLLLGLAAGPGRGRSSLPRRSPATDAAAH